MSLIKHLCIIKNLLTIKRKERYRIYKTRCYPLNWDEKYGWNCTNDPFILVGEWRKEIIYK